MSEDRVDQQDPDAGQDSREGPPDFVREELLAHPLRRSIIQTLRERPGINKHQLAQEHDVNPGVIDHHLDRLEAAGLAATRSEGKGNEVHCFVPDDVEYWSKEQTRGLFGRSGVREVALYLADNPGATTDEISEALNLSLSTVRHHIRSLESNDLVERYRAGRTFLYDTEPDLERWIEEIGHSFDTESGP